MEISKSLLYRNLHFLAIEQLAEEYKKQGYEVKKEAAIGKYIADLIAVKGSEKIVVEVKAGRMTPLRKKQLEKLADYVNSLEDYKFKIVIARPPKDKNIQILGFEDLLFEHLMTDFPDELDELSTHTFIEMVSDIEIHDLIIYEKNEINVIGQGIIDVKLQYGSDGDQTRGDGLIHYESFPFDFDLYLSYESEKKLIIKDGASIEIDTDSFYS